MQGIKSFLCDSLRLLWMVFFRPKSLRQEAARFNRQRRWRLVAQALAVTTVVASFLTTLAGLLLEGVFIPFDFADGLIGVVKGILVGVLFGTLFSLLGGVARGVLYGVLFGLLFGVLGGAAGGVLGGALGGVLYGALFGLLFGTLYGVVGGMARDVSFGVLFGVFGGVLFSVLFGVLFGVPGGAVSGAAFLVSYFRLFLLPVEALTTLWALRRTRRQPMGAARFLRQSLAYWDEVMLLPQPFLTPLLALVGKQDRDALQGAAAHLMANTFQGRVAEGVKRKKEMEYNA